MTAKPAVDKETLQLIRKIILEEAGNLGVEIERIILFGSRARGDYREDSDYDILIIVKGKIDRRTKVSLAARIGSILTRLLDTPVDVVIVSGLYWKEYHNQPGTILYPASREGVTIA